MEKLLKLKLDELKLYGERYAIPKWRRIRKATLAEKLFNNTKFREKFNKITDDFTKEQRLGIILNNEEIPKTENTPNQYEKLNFNDDSEDNKWEKIKQNAKSIKGQTKYQSEKIYERNYKKEGAKPKRKLAPNFIKPQKQSNKTFNWGNYSFKVMDKDEFSKKLADLTNENVLKLTNNKKPQPRPRKNVNISDSVRDELTEEEFIIKELETALNRYLKIYRIDGRKGYDPRKYLNKIKEKVIDLINEKKKPIKVNFMLTCNLIKESLAENSIEEETEGYFNSNMEIITDSDDLSEMFDIMKNRILKEYEKFLSNAYKFKFDYVKKFDIGIVPYNPLRGSSYIPLPKKLAAKQGIINPKNFHDNECFKWSIMIYIMIHKYKKDVHLERITKEMRERSKELNWSGIEFPVSVFGTNQIEKFESQNPYGINVFSYEEGELRIINRSRKLDAEKINLLFLTEGEKTHFCFIKNIGRINNKNYNNNGCARFYCDNCLNSFYSEQTLEEHKIICYNNEEVMIKMPKNEDGTPKHIEFNNFNRKMKAPFGIYGDLECFTEKIDSCSPDKSKSYTEKYQKHKPSGYSYFTKFFDDKIYKPCLKEYTANSPDDDVAKKFVLSLDKEAKKIYEIIKSRDKEYYKKVVMTEEDKIDYEYATHCHICENKLGEDKVLDHCHLTGKYRGAAHKKCNLDYKIPKFIPVIIHNLSRYDSHFIINKLGLTEGKIDCIPKNEENYIYFKKDVVVDSYIDKNGKQKPITIELRFIDSFKFMPSSLSSLAENLTKCGKCGACKPGDCIRRYIKDGKVIQYKGIGKCGECKNCNLAESKCISPTDEKLTLTRRYFGKNTNIMIRKGVFFYDYFDSFDKLNETELPKKEAFYSKLNDEHITEDDYQHAKKVWETFNMKTIRDYHDIYLKSDVLLLADVFENFRNVCIKNYGLDPAWYFTAPSLAWDAMLKLTKVKLELLTDVDMLLMFEEGVRGGVSQISNRYAKANNPYMSNFISGIIKSYIIYLDANNLYGGSMSEKLPTHGFGWVEEEDLKNWRNIPGVYKVELEYPKHLHDLHNDYPLAPDKMKVNKVQKLIPNLKNKKEYVVHYKTLKFYESKGLKITKIHKGIKFEESAWLKPYIDLNTKLRSQAKNEFEKDFFKLMNNSVFGKTMENIRKRVDIRLVTNEKDAKKLTTKPNFNHFTIFSENLAAIHMKKTSLTFNKPVYLGMCILDLSKTIMYDFHYNYIKPKYGEKAKLLMTDTDSLVYYIETEDFYKDINPDVRDKFDTSNFPKDHPSGIETGVNKKVVNMFKDEAGGKIIKEFVGLRAKLYSYLMENDEEIKKCKGMKKAAIKKKIIFNHYKDCLFTGKPQMRPMNVIRSHLHDVYTETINKVALSANDDKRIICENKISTLAYGHYSLKTESGGSSVSNEIV